MQATDWLQAAALLIVLGVACPLLGRYIAAVFADGDPAERRAPGDRVFGPIERLVYRVAGVDPSREQRWNIYAVSVLAFMRQVDMLDFGDDCPYRLPKPPALLLDVEVSVKQNGIDAIPAKVSFYSKDETDRYGSALANQSLPGIVEVLVHIEPEGDPED